MGLLLNDADFSAFYNSTIPAYDESSAPCSVTVPGFSSIGLMMAYMVVFVFSMVGNSVVVCVVCNMKNGRSSTDFYLMHLAMADLLFSITLPFWAISAHTGWIFGNVLCKVLSSLLETSMYGSVFLLVCISIERHFAIVRATRVLSSHHLWVKVTCGVVWVVALLLSLPVAIQKESMATQDLGQTICHEKLTGESGDHWRVSIHLLHHTLGFFLPLVMMSISYGWTLVTLLHTRNQKKHRAMCVILAVVLAFVLCWLPYNITVLIDTLIRGGALEVETCETLYIVEVILNVTQVLAFMHCAVNPVLYAFIGQKFRNHLLSILYKQGFIRNRVFRTHSGSSTGIIRSRNTSTT
ncbi:C-X-C chemokine receptor type 1 [Antennarius striatus]|uniref:C-X-C chemokine receptor type 1 n=1 Tax=Antennarius striatus TaxID=241820 RepID=UPI0035AF02FD